MVIPPRQGYPLRIDPDAIRADAVVAVTKAAIVAARKVFDKSRPARSPETILKAAALPATTTSAAWAGVHSHVTMQWLGSLTPKSAGVNLLGRGLVLSFNGAGSIALPALALTPAPFISEGRAIPVRQYTSDAGPRLEPRKIALITSLTREVVDSSNAEAIITDALATSAALGLDNVLFSASAASADAPAGLRFGISAITANTSTLKAEALAADLAALGGAIGRAVTGEIVFVAAPENALSITLMLPTFKHDVLSTSALPKGVVIAVAVNGLVSAFDATPEITADRDSSFVLDDTNPGDVLSGKTLSLFQNDLIALTMKMHAAWLLRTPNALAWLSGATW